ncbi:SGNH/GDSL hydrolase family protein [Streptomyces sp. NPDC050433]|uniref:SGNH/GDSL hydrolase family protein n=1 Tax=Streptomyces sp. NPDC050433 TaxID=3365615 RepID=UPI00379FE49E
MRCSTPFSRIAAVLVLVLAVVGTSLSAESGQAQAAPAAPDPDLGAPISWLALGDSFSAGEGSMAWVGDTDCAQDEIDSYPVVSYGQLARQGINWKNSELDFQACSGATADGTDPWDLPAQLARVGDKKYDLITLTLGGNDAGYVGILLDCLGANWRTIYRNGRCNKTSQQMRAQVDAVGPILEDAYDRVERRLKPDGRMIVLGYPWIFENPSQWSASTDRCHGFHRNDIVKTRSNVASRLNLLIEETSTKRGHHFLDVERDAAFRGRNLCAKGESYMNGWWLDEGTNVRVHGSFHPNTIGHSAMAMALTLLINKINRDPDSGPAGFRDLVGRWEYRGEFRADRASLIITEDGDARYFTEGDPYDYLGRVKPLGGYRYRLDLVGMDYINGEPDRSRTVSLRPQLRTGGLSFHDRSNEHNRIFWLGCLERDVGSWYKKLEPSRDRCERNHVPAKSAYWPKGKSKDVDFGPAVRMDQDDHRRVTSTGSSATAVAWQDQQRDHLQKCEFAEAMRMDIDEIKKLFPGKYDRAITAMVRSLPENKGLQNWLKTKQCTIDYSKLP